MKHCKRQKSEIKPNKHNQGNPASGQLGLDWWYKYIDTNILQQQFVSCINGITLMTLRYLLTIDWNVQDRYYILW